MEIVPGLHQLKVPIPTGIGYVLPYLFETAGGFVIVDPGWDTDVGVSSLESQLGELGIGLKDLKCVLATHVHPDHYGMAARIREVSGAELIVHERDREYLRERSARFQIQDAWLVGQGMPEEEAMGHSARNAAGSVDDTTDMDPDSIVADGELLRFGRFELRVIWTPGHTPGHACFYEEREELLLTGDHVLPRITPNVRLGPFGASDPLADYLRSLRRLRGMRVKLVLPAHEYEFIGLDERLEDLKRHHEARSSEILSAIDDGATTGYEVASSIAWSSGGFEGLDIRNRKAAVAETLAHLRYLVNLAVVTEYEHDGVTRFGRAGEAAD